MPVNRVPARLIATTMLLAGMSACSNSPTRGGVPWWPQGPGNVDEVMAEESARAAAKQPAATKPTPAAQPAAGEAAMPAADTAPAVPVPENVSTAPVMREAPMRTAARPTLTLVPQFARYGDLLFVSGQIAEAGSMDGTAATIGDETRLVMQKIQAILESQHLTTANVVSTTIYLADIDELAAVEAVYDSFFRGARPASSAVAVNSLPANARVQIAVVAGR